MESLRVGIILDSSVIIAAGRRGHSVSQILEQVYRNQGEVEVGLSVVTSPNWCMEHIEPKHRSRR